MFNNAPFSTPNINFSFANNPQQSTPVSYNFNSIPSNNYNSQINSTPVTTAPKNFNAAVLDMTSPDRQKKAGKLPAHLASRLQQPRQSKFATQQQQDPQQQQHQQQQPSSIPPTNRATTTTGRKQWQRTTTTQKPPRPIVANQNSFEPPMDDNEAMQIFGKKSKANFNPSYESSAPPPVRNTPPQHKVWINPNLRQQQQQNQQFDQDASLEEDDEQVDFLVQTQPVQRQTTPRYHQPQQQIQEQHQDMEEDSTMPTPHKTPQYHTRYQKRNQFVSPAKNNFQQYSQQQQSFYQQQQQSQYYNNQTYQPQYQQQQHYYSQPQQQQQVYENNYRQPHYSQQDLNFTITVPQQDSYESIQDVSFSDDAPPITTPIRQKPTHKTPQRNYITRNVTGNTPATINEQGPKSASRKMKLDSQAVNRMVRNELQSNANQSYQQQQQNNLYHGNATVTDPLGQFGEEEEVFGDPNVLDTSMSGATPYVPNKFDKSHRFATPKPVQQTPRGNKTQAPTPKTQKKEVTFKVLFDDEEDTSSKKSIKSTPKIRRNLAKKDTVVDTETPSTASNYEESYVVEEPISAKPTVIPLDNIPTVLPKKSKPSSSSLLGRLKKKVSAAEEETEETKSNTSTPSTASKPTKQAIVKATTPSLKSTPKPITPKISKPSTTPASNTTTLKTSSPPLKTPTVFKKPKVDAILLRPGQFIGTCKTMCPPLEIEEREMQRELDYFEIDPDYLHENPPKAKPEWCVKKYRRSSAADQKPSAEMIRPPTVLFETLEYLMNYILLRQDKSFDIVYNFIRDRVRSIAQDLTYQNLREESSVTIHEIISRFHILCHFKLSTLNRLDRYDPTSDMELLNKYLKSLREFYRELREKQNIHCPNEAEFTAYYIITREDENDVSQCLREMPTYLQKNELIQWALQGFKYVHNQFFGPFFKLLDKVPYLMACCLFQHYAKMRFIALKSFSKGIAKQSYPLAPLVSLLDFSNETEAYQFVSAYGGKIDDSTMLCTFPSKLVEPQTEVIPALPLRIENKAEGLSYAEIVSTPADTTASPLEKYSPVKEQYEEPAEEEAEEEEEVAYLPEEEEEEQYEQEEEEEEEEYPVQEQVTEHEEEEAEENFTVHIPTIASPKQKIEERKKSLSPPLAVTVPQRDSINFIPPISPISKSKESPVPISTSRKNSVTPFETPNASLSVPLIQRMEPSPRTKSLQEMEKKLQEEAKKREMEQQRQKKISNLISKVEKKTKKEALEVWKNTAHLMKQARKQQNKEVRENLKQLCKMQSEQMNDLKRIDWIKNIEQQKTITELNSKLMNYQEKYDYLDQLYAPIDFSWEVYQQMLIKYPNQKKSVFTLLLVTEMNESMDTFSNWFLSKFGAEFSNNNNNDTWEYTISSNDFDSELLLSNGNEQTDKTVVLRVKHISLKQKQQFTEEEICAANGMIFILPSQLSSSTEIPHFFNQIYAFLEKYFSTYSLTSATLVTLFDEKLMKNLNIPSPQLVFNGVLSQLSQSLQHKLNSNCLTAVASDGIDFGSYHDYSSIDAMSLINNYNSHIKQCVQWTIYHSIPSPVIYQFHFKEVMEEIMDTYFSKLLLPFYENSIFSIRNAKCLYALQIDLKTFQTHFNTVVQCFKEIQFENNIKLKQLGIGIKNIDQLVAQQFISLQEYCKEIDKKIDSMKYETQSSFSLSCTTLKEFITSLYQSVSHFVAPFSAATNSTWQTQQFQFAIVNLLQQFAKHSIANYFPVHKLYEICLDYQLQWHGKQEEEELLIVSAFSKEEFVSQVLHKVMRKQVLPLKPEVIATFELEEEKSLQVVPKKRKLNQKRSKRTVEKSIATQLVSEETQPNRDENTGKSETKRQKTSETSFKKQSLAEEVKKIIEAEKVQSDAFGKKLLEFGEVGSSLQSMSLPFVYAEYTKVNYIAEEENFMTETDLSMSEPIKDYTSILDEIEKSLDSFDKKYGFYQTEQN